MKAQKWIRVVIMIAGVVTLVVCGAWAWYIAAPVVDDRIGIVTARHMRELLSAKVDNDTLQARLNQRLQGVTCRAWHRDELWQTFVTCYGTSRDGRAVDFYWEVDKGVSPSDGTSQPGFHFTALTKATALLTPNYQPGGVKLADMPDSPSMTAGALYMLRDR